MEVKDAIGLMLTAIVIVTCIFLFFTRQPLTTDCPHFSVQWVNQTVPSISFNVQIRCYDRTYDLQNCTYTTPETVHNVTYNVYTCLNTTTSDPVIVKQGG